MVNYQNTAQGLATLGRGGDSTLVHMNPSEVAGLQNLAARNGTSLTTNPNTGMPEAFNLRGLIPMAVGAGLTAATAGTAGAISPLMAGLMVGGATAVLEGDIMAGLGAGLGAYGGGSLAEGFQAAATSVPAGSTTAGLNEAAINQSLVSANPTLTAGNSLTAGGAQGFSSAGGTMGIDGALYNDATSITSKVGTPNPNNFAPGSKVPGIRDAFSGGYNPPAVQPTVANAANSTIPPHLRQTGTQQALNNTGITDALTKRNLNAIDNNLGLNSVSVDSVSDNFSRVGEGAKNVITDYSATRDAMGLTDGEMAMKFGLPIAGGIAGGLEESDFQPDPVDMAQFEDRRYRGPDGQLNLSGESGLNLNNPYGYTAGGYGYAEGGAVEQGMEAAIARNSGVASITSDKGMAGALARNEGIAYTPPTTTTAYTPPTTDVSSSNINVGGFRGGGTNLTGALGSLNVGSGTIGKSPDQAFRDTKFKMLRGYEVPLDFTPGSPGGQGNIYSGYTQPTQASHTYNSATKQWEKSKPLPYVSTYGQGHGGIGNQYMGQQAFSGYGGPKAGVAQFAEGGYLGGGDVNVQGDGMSDDIPANIDNEQPAALSEGEFVVPADVVSHIGNGSSEAGAKEFYGMMDRVRMARTGRKKQSPEIDPERFMPA